MDMVFDLDAPFEQGLLDGPVEKRPLAFVAGLFEKGIRIRPTGRVHQVGVVFKPGKFRYFIPGNQKEVKGLVLPLDTIYPRQALQLIDRLQHSASDQARFEFLAGFLESSLRRDLNENYFLDRCLQHIHACKGNFSLERYTAGSKISARHFRRIFKEYVGINPKLYCMMVRLVHLIRMSARESANLQKISLELGYYDPSHLSRDFKSIAGMQAREFIRRDDLIMRSLMPAV